MKKRLLTANLILPALLAAAFTSCGLPARELPYALTHQIASVQSESMAPTIKPGDHVAIKVGYYDKLPVQRFDIVAYKHRPETVGPTGEDAETVFIGRIIGMGGEKVEFKDRKVFVNGRLLEEPFELVPPMPPDQERNQGLDPGRPVVNVPPGEYLLLGDNRPNSYDGRYWGGWPTLPKSYLHGKVTEIFPQNAAPPAATP